MSLKKHKKHKSEKRERHDGGEKPPGLRLILKMNSSTPDNSSDSMGLTIDEESSRMSATSSSMLNVRDDTMSSVNATTPGSDRAHKKAKKKKKKKEKDRDKHGKKHKHHHKEKRKRRDDVVSSQDDGSVGEESLSELPSKRIDTGVHSHGPASEEQSSRSRGRDSDGDGSGRDPLREPRTCVLRQRQERTPLQRLLEHLLKGLEKKDPSQLFAWPVTDNIAPAYSEIITHPMDFSTMKHKIDNHIYSTLASFVDDFKLLCNNAMVYNQSHTIYYKAAKKLLHAGLKMMSPEKVRALRSGLPYLVEIESEALGFDVEMELANGSASASEKMGNAAAVSRGALPEESAEADSLGDADGDPERKRSKPMVCKFEAIPDDLTSEEILQQAQKVHQTVTQKLAARKLKTSMGFLRQRKDGTTSLSILVPGDGVVPGTSERPVSLGTITGKLTHGTGTLQGFREDRRNLAKTVKPLYYGAFGSYAPSHDSTFANLSKEESDLVYQTYGDENSVQYAESILDFAKDNDYTINMVDNLLDILTHGEHRRTKRTLEDRRRMREEDERLQAMMDGARSNEQRASQAAQPQPWRPPSSSSSSTPGQIEAQPPESGQPAAQAPLNPQAAASGLATPGHSALSQSNPPAPQMRIAPPPVNVGSLKSLKDLGIDTSFLDVFERSQREAEEQRAAQLQLNVTGSLLEKLQQVQSDRLSTAPPPHLSQVMQPSIVEQQLAEKITENLTDLAKRVPPGVIVPVSAVRKAMGVAPEISGELADRPTTSPAPPRDDQPATKGRVDVILSANVSKDAPLSAAATNGASAPNCVGGEASVVSVSAAEGHSNSSTAMPDLETELREFLESEPTLSNTALHDEQSMEIEDILSGP